MLIEVWADDSVLVLISNFSVSQTSMNLFWEVDNSNTPDLLDDRVKDSRGETAMDVAVNRPASSQLRNLEAVLA